MRILRFSHCFASFTVASGLVLAASSLGQAQTAGQDIHQAGTSTKNAAKEAGTGVKKGTTTSYTKTKEGATKGYDKTKEGTTKGYDKTKEGTQHLTGSKSQASTSEDKAKEKRQ